MSQGFTAGLVLRHAGRALRQAPGNALILPAKTIGAAGEQLFYSRALRRGFNVSVPIGDNSRYDCLIDTSTKIHRIQIKTSSKPDGHSGRYGFSLMHGSVGHTYDGEDFDFFALVCLDVDVLYIVPIAELEGRTTAKVRRGVETRLEQYREAWSQL